MQALRESEVTIFWSLLAAVCAVALEYLYRRLDGGWWEYLWVWTPLSLCISYSICKLIRTPGLPLVGALIIWSVAIMGLRVLVSAVILRDHIALGTWVALGLMVLARISQQVWR